MGEGKELGGIAIDKVAVVGDEDRQVFIVVVVTAACIFIEATITN